MTAKKSATTKQGTVMKGKNQVKMTQADVLIKLDKACKKMVRNTVLRYMNGPYAGIFNDAEMSALAQDTALEVARRIEIWNNDPEAKGAVIPSGSEAYFCRAFINQCQKLYEKHAKTDIRAAIQTVSSEEALQVAASRNLENPENQWILKGEIDNLLVELERIDAKVNALIAEQCQRENRKPNNNEFQYSKFIIEKTLEGYEPNEIREMIGLSESDYARHRKAALELAKERVNLSFSDLVEHFNDKVDPRIYTKEVKKRKKIPSRIRNYQVSPNFYIQSTMIKEENKCLTSLFVRIDILEDEQITKEVKAKLIKLEEKVGDINNSNADRESMWNKTKDPEFIKKIINMGQEYLQSVKKTA